MSGVVNDQSQARPDTVEAELDGVELALERLDRGTYGTCAKCGAPLSDELLAAHPLSVECVPTCPPGSGANPALTID